ncbi:hypothetical protein BDR03DRAFT_1010852 [Suillus americanus]|nr:hypothetical protein BDR03DRAFT_1010852 [Suillus americanus]
MNKIAMRAGLTESLFERLVIPGHQTLSLQVQYHKRPHLSEFPSYMFYEGGATAPERLRKNVDFPWPAPGIVLDHVDVVTPHSSYIFNYMQFNGSLQDLYNDIEVASVDALFRMSNSPFLDALLIH